MWKIFEFVSSKMAVMIPSFSGQTCNNDAECGLPNSGNCTSQKCDCHIAKGYEDSNGPDAKGVCTKLGRLRSIDSIAVC